MNDKMTVSEEAKTRNVSEFSVLKRRNRYYPDARRSPEQSCAGCEFACEVNFPAIGKTLQCEKIGISGVNVACIQHTGRCEKYKRAKSLRVLVW